MRVMVIPVDASQDPYTIEIDGSLYSLQKIVDGYIEPCAPAQLKECKIELLANEEGLLAQLPVNDNLYPFFLVGQVVAVGIGDEDFVSLTDFQVNYLKYWLTHLTTEDE